MTKTTTSMMPAPGIKTVNMIMGDTLDLKFVAPSTGTYEIGIHKLVAVKFAPQIEQWNRGMVRAAMKQGWEFRAGKLWIINNKFKDHEALNAFLVKEAEDKPNGIAAHALLLIVHNRLEVAP